jgi:NadR type nicotinamide-nucleotide adenylyltransferase
LGKFMPPHAGHQYLIDFARAYADDLAVVVGSLADEPIAGSLRFAWMQGLYPDLRVLHLQDENPQEPAEHPDFWDIWRTSLQKILPWRPDCVFASEDYGEKLAQVLGARFVPVDLGRTTIPISATAIRDDPWEHWRYLPACVRSHYAFRVCVFGPESTGKTTLSKSLASHLQTTCVPEYARTYLEQRGGRLEAMDLPAIARGQAASEDALVGQCNRFLVCDTDTLATQVWSEALYGHVDPVVESLARTRGCDLYILCDVDIPWVADRVRYLPDERREFFERCQKTLEGAGRHYVVVRGSREERLGTAIEAISARQRI